MYEVHVTPLLSVFSALSYLAPVGRIEWFAFVQAVLHVPIGIAVYVVASRLDMSVARAAAAAIAALAFSFCGIVLWDVAYPHFEIATAGLTCVAIGAIVSGRTRTAWTCVVLAALVKQDGGLHIATAIAPLWLLRSRPALIAMRRQLVAMIAVAIGITVLEVVLQRLIWHPFPRFTQAYLGTPPFAHLTCELLRTRLARLAEIDQVLWYPVIATALLAAVRRDPAYLLGWASLVPWFTLNLIAAEEAKSAFVGYMMVPFLVGLFWVYAYGARVAPRPLPGLTVEAAFALACIASTLGFHRGQPYQFRSTVRDLWRSHVHDRDAVTAFVDALRTHRADLGVLSVDYAVAALGIEWFALADRWVSGRPTDAIAFHEQSQERSQLLPDVLSFGLDTCVRAHRTHFVVCMRPAIARDISTALASPTFPAIALTVRVAGDDLAGTLGVLPRGHYAWTMMFDADAPARLEVLRDDGASLGVATGTGSVSLEFDADGTTDYRLAAPHLVVTGARIARLR